MPGIVCNNPEGIRKTPGPFHWPEIWDARATVEGSNTTSHAVSLPTCAPGDLLVVPIVGQESNSLDGLAFPSESPEEWTIHYNGTPSGASAISYAIASKRASEADSNATIFVTTTSNQKILSCAMAIAGAKDTIQGVSSPQGFTGTTCDFYDLAIPYIQRWLFIGVFGLEDNRGLDLSQVGNEWADFLLGNAVSFDRRLGDNSDLGSDPGGWILAHFRQIATAVGNDITGDPDTPENNGGPGPITWDTSEGGIEHVIAIEPTDGDLYNETEATIVNPNAATDVSGWTNITGTLTRSGGTGADGSPGFFYGGNTVDMEAYQNVPIPTALHAAVDEGRVRCRLRWKGNSFGNDDEWMILTWHDDESPENQLGDAVASTEGFSHGGWVDREHRHVAPIGARSLRITMHADRDQSSQNDGYFDNIRLFFREYLA